MAESIAEQIAEALKTALEGIVADGGTTYWYRPDKVLRVSFFPDQFTFDPAYGEVQYVLSPDPEEIVEEGTSHQCKAELGFVLQVAKQHRVPTENPYLEQPPIRWTVANRLIRDAVKRLDADVQLAGLAVNVNTVGISIDRDQYAEGWAMAQLRFTVSYDFNGATP